MTSNVSIETARLSIRTVTMTDIEDVASSWKLDVGPIPRTEAEQKISWMLSNHAQNTPGKLAHLCLAIILKDTDEFIGWCGLDHLDQTKTDPALFYLLKANYWGKGLATEAAKALLDYAFTQLNLASIHAGAAPENIASKRVMEKIGMKYVGLDEEGGYAFTITKEEYWNMDIEYLDTLDDVTPDQLQGFFVGWPHPPKPSTHYRMLQGSQHILLARDRTTHRIVGFITAISDGILCAYIPLLEVLPAYQHAGIGTRLLKDMLAKLAHLYAVDLLCDADLQPFYQRFGMHPASGMMMRNYAGQSGDQATEIDSNPRATT